MRRFVRLCRIFYANELKLMARSQESIFATLLFSLLVILIIHLGFAGLGYQRNVVALATILIAILFGGILRLNRSFEPEQPCDVLQGLSQMTGIHTPLFMGKLLANLLLILVLGAISCVITALLFNLTFEVRLMADGVIVIMLFVIGLSAVGTIFSAMLASRQRKDLLLPVILYPILFPLILAALKSLEFSAGGDYLGLAGVWVQVAIIFDIITLVLAFLVVESVLEVA